MTSKIHRLPSHGILFYGRKKAKTLKSHRLPSHGILSYGRKKAKVQDVPTAITLPNEIWVEIFQYAFGVTLKSLSLTCHNFRSLVLPLLFRHLEVTTRFIPLPRNDPNTLGRIAKLQARIVFFASPRISPLVRECRLGTFSLDQTEEESQMEVAAFDLLLHFVNLTTLTCQGTAINTRRATILRTLASNSLISLAFVDCPITSCGILPRIGIRSLTIVYEQSGTPHAQLVSIDDLRSLTITAEEWPPYLKMARMLNLRQLHLTFAAVVSYLADCPPLDNYPFLEILSIMPHDLTMMWVSILCPSPVKLPHLRSYEGFAACLHAFTNTESLRRLCLCVPGDVSIMANSLRYIARQAPNLQELQLLPAYLVDDLFEAICSVPLLRDLELEIARVYYTYQDPSTICTCEELTSRLQHSLFPASIEEIRILTSLPSRESLTYSALRSMLANLINPVRYPKLQYAEVTTQGFHWAFGCTSHECE